MDAEIKLFLDALRQVCDGKVDVLDAGPIKIKRICDGLVMMQFFDRHFLCYQKELPRSHNSSHRAP